MSEKLTTIDIQHIVKKMLEDKYYYRKDKLEYRKPLLTYLNRTKPLLEVSKKKIYDGKDYRGFNLYAYLIESWPTLVFEITKVPNIEASLITHQSKWEKHTTFEGTQYVTGKSILKRESRIPVGKYGDAPKAGFLGINIMYVLPDEKGEMISLYAISAETNQLLVYHIVLEEKLKDE